MNSFLKFSTQGPSPKLGSEDFFFVKVKTLRFSEYKNPTWGTLRSSDKLKEQIEFIEPMAQKVSTNT